MGYFSVRLTYRSLFTSISPSGFPDCNGVIVTVLHHDALDHRLTADSRIFHCIISSPAAASCGCVQKEHKGAEPDLQAQPLDFSRLLLGVNAILTIELDQYVHGQQQPSAGQYRKNGT